MTTRVTEPVLAFLILFIAIAELKATNMFNQTKPRDEEEEHSLEMHLPYLVKLFGGMNVQLVPMMVG